MNKMYEVLKNKQNLHRSFPVESLSKNVNSKGKTTRRFYTWIDDNIYIIIVS